MRVRWAIFAQVSAFLAEETLCKCRSSILYWFGALRESMPRLPTIIAILGFMILLIVVTMLHSVATLSTKQTDLFTVPSVLAGTTFGNMISGATDEAALSWFRSGDSERVFAQAFRPRLLGSLHISSSILTLVALALLAISVGFSFVSISIEGWDRISMRLQMLLASQTLPLIGHVASVAFLPLPLPSSNSQPRALAKYSLVSPYTHLRRLCLFRYLEPLCG